MEIHYKQAGETIKFTGLYVDAITEINLRKQKALPRKNIYGKEGFCQG